MILLDTNVVVDALDRRSAFRKWAVDQIENAVLAEGGAVNVVSIAETCAGTNAPGDIIAGLEALGLELVDVPVKAGPVCGKAYSRSRAARRTSGGGTAPSTPLPDFLIGAHAEAMGWKLATRDGQRFRTYFPSVELVEPR